jgi:hypothetical protein
VDINGVLVVLFVIPALAATVLRRTRVWWLPGVAVTAVGVYLLATSHEDMPHYDGSGEGMAALSYGAVGDTIGLAASVVVLVFAGMLLLLPFLSRKAAEPPPTTISPNIPPARAVENASKPDRSDPKRR